MTTPVGGATGVGALVCTELDPTAPLSLASAITDVNSRYPAATDLERLPAAAVLGESLERCGEALVRHFITKARAQGRPWSAIAEALGVSKQAAHKRFNDRRQPA